MNNILYLKGRISTPLTYSHEIKGEKIYTFYMDIIRLSNNIDTIPIHISERVADFGNYSIGDFIEIKGELRTHNESMLSGKTSLKIYGFAKEIRVLENEEYANEVILRGFLCKEPNFRETPLGREIADVLLAVNRTYNKSDYIPAIVWSRNASYIKRFSVGTELSLKGRIQSRKYNKKVEDGIVERVALELSVSQLEIIASNDTN